MSGRNDSAPAATTQGRETRDPAPSGAKAATGTTKLIPPAAQLEAGLLRFISETLLPGVRLTRDTYLFADGLINSMRILDLVAFVEHAIGRDIRDVEVTMEHFRTVGDIVRTFAAVEEASEA